MRLKSNAESIASTKLVEKSTIALYLSLKSCKENNYETVFIQSLQSYVTRLGLILKECVIEPVYKYPTTLLGSIDYICKDIINDKSLHQIFKKVLGINEDGNNIKHSLKNVDTNINSVVDQYNLLIKRIISTTDIQAFKKCFINEKKVSNNLFDDNRCQKFGMLNNVKFDARILPIYQIDKYARTVKIKIKLKWFKAKYGQALKLSISSKNKTLFTGGPFNISSNGYKSFVFSVPENCLDGRIIFLDCELSLLHEESKYTHTTGVLWWKQDHYSNVNVKDKSISFKISQNLTKLVDNI